MHEHETPGARGRSSCACDPGASIGQYFDRKVQAASSGAPNLHATTRALIDLLGPARGHTLLELGAGRGGLLLAALREGATHASGVDLSARSIEQARDRLSAAGFADQVTLTVGDGAALDLPGHDWVVLDRVICCYPAADALVARSSRAAGARYAFAVPDSRGWRGLAARLALGFVNASHRLHGVSCRTFVHDLARIEGAVGAAGFRRVATAHRGLWYVAVFERPS